MVIIRCANRSDGNLNGAFQKKRVNPRALAMTLTGFVKRWGILGPISVLNSD